MHDPSRQAPELKALLANLRAKISPRKKLRAQAADLTTEIIAKLQCQNRLK